MNKTLVIFSHDMKYGDKVVLGVCDNTERADEMITEFYQDFSDYREMSHKENPEEGVEFQLIIQANNRTYKVSALEFKMNEL